MFPRGLRREEECWARAGRLQPTERETGGDASAATAGSLGVETRLLGERGGLTGVWSGGS
jgi:hypothetical protein